MEIVRHTLLRLGFPRREIVKYTDVVRSESYDTAIQSPEEHRALHLMLDALHGIDISWVVVADGNANAGRTLAEADLRAQTGTTILAVRRGATLLANPAPELRLSAGDQLALIGEPSQVAAAESLLAARED